MPAPSPPTWKAILCQELLYGARNLRWHISTRRERPPIEITAPEPSDQDHPGAPSDLSSPVPIHAVSAICNCSSQLQCACLSCCATVRSADPSLLRPAWIALDDACRLQDGPSRPKA